MGAVGVPHGHGVLRMMAILVAMSVGMLLGVGVSTAETPAACDTVDMAQVLGQWVPCPPTPLSLPSIDPLVSGSDGVDIAAGGLFHAGTRVG